MTTICEPHCLILRQQEVRVYGRYKGEVQAFSSV